MIKAVFFDLDGSLLPMNEEEFTKTYFGLLCRKAAPYGYDKDKLVQTIWAGTKAMKNNDGSKTNEEAFWEVFASVYGVDEAEKMEKVFGEFYRNEFKQTKAVCFENPYAREIVDFCKQKGVKIAITTSPFFPKDGVVSRLGFLGLSESDFDLITSYENSSFCKPNPNYYFEICKKIGVNPHNAIMIGNDEREDMKAATEAGLMCYLVTDCRIMAKDFYWTGQRGTFEQSLRILKII